MAVFGYSRRPRRMAGALLALVLLATAASGCDAGRPPAPVVNGHDIPAPVLESLLEMLAAD